MTRIRIGTHEIGMSPSDNNALERAAWQKIKTIYQKHWGNAWSRLYMTPHSASDSS